ncbi:hypothetical protein [Clostridium butyricum]|uniref:hypothetical protein n=1 Tax=Clostridium butyricum TaxID=1492 RepID=UPI00189DD39C|nr:hypothetical protein [Clostridium butyricum]MDB2153811.1 hypothetical protein [Clostridium butyricum]
MLQLIENISIDELESKIREKQFRKNNSIRISLESTKKELDKKKIGIMNMEKELLDIFSGESSMDKSILTGMMTKTKVDIESLEKKIKLLEKEDSEGDKSISINRSLIEQYKNFNYVYGLADNKQKKLLLQEVVEKITFDGDKLIIILFLE